jgi:hypothetical protein
VKDRRIVLLGTSKNNGHDCSSNYTSALVSKATGQETNLKKANQQKPISVTFMLILLEGKSPHPILKGCHYVSKLKIISVKRKQLQSVQFFDL